MNNVHPAHYRLLFFPKATNL